MPHACGHRGQGAMCSPDAAAGRSVEADGALPPFSAFSWGCKMAGWLSAVLDFRDNSKSF